MEDYEKYLKDLEEADRTRLTVEKAHQLTMDREALIAYDYVVDMPEGVGGHMPTEEGGVKKCEKCSTEYIVHGNMTEVSTSCTERVSLALTRILHRQKRLHVCIIGAARRSKVRLETTVKWGLS